MNTTRAKKSEGYPWDDWFSRSKFRVVEGRDFKCMPHSMMVQIRNAASSRGKSVSVRATNAGNRTTLSVTVKD